MEKAARRGFFSAGLLRLRVGGLPLGGRVPHQPVQRRELVRERRAQVQEPPRGVRDAARVPEVMVRIVPCDRGTEEETWSEVEWVTYRGQCSRLPGLRYALWTLPRCPLDRAVRRAALRCALCRVAHQ